MAKITASWDDSETEKILNAVEKIATLNSLGEKIEEIEKSVKQLQESLKKLQQSLESEVPQSNSATC